MKRNATAAPRRTFSAPSGGFLGNFFAAFFGTGFVAGDFFAADFFAAFFGGLVPAAFVVAFVCCPGG